MTYEEYFKILGSKNYYSKSYPITRKNYPVTFIKNNDDHTEEITEADDECETYDMDFCEEDFCDEYECDEEICEEEHSPKVPGDDASLDEIIAWARETRNPYRMIF